MKPVRPAEVPVPQLKFGSYGVYALESTRLRPEHIEAARVCVVKTVGRKDLKIWMRVFPHIPVTSKPVEVRMGKGKGNVDHFVSFVRAGKMLLEFDCPQASAAKLAVKALAYKMPIKVRFVSRERISTRSL